MSFPCGTVDDLILLILCMASLEDDLVSLVRKDPEHGALFGSSPKPTGRKRRGEGQSHGMLAKKLTICHVWEQTSDRRETEEPLRSGWAPEMTLDCPS